LNGIAFKLSFTYRPSPTPRYESGLSPFGKGFYRSAGGGRTGEDGKGENGVESKITDGNATNNSGKSNESSPWVYNGKDYGTLDALLKATSGPKYYDIPSDDIPVFSKEKVVCEANSYGTSSDNLLWKMYFHYQFGGTSDFILNAFTLDFSHTNQGQLGLSGWKIGDKDNVNLFKGGIGKISLAFGNVEMLKISRNMFKISANEFDMNYDVNGSLSRNLGTFGAGIVFGQLFDTPIMAWAIIRNTFKIGGPYTVIFNGKVYIKE